MAAADARTRRSAMRRSVSASRFSAVLSPVCAAFSACWAEAVLLAATSIPASSARTAFSRSSSLAFSVLIWAASWAFLVSAASRLS